MNVPSTLLKRKIAFWQAHGLLEEINANLYQLCEENNDNGGNSHEEVEEEAESAMASAEDQREEELQVYEMLINFVNYCCCYNMRSW